MDQEHEAHLNRVKFLISDAIDRKYRLGQAEHGGKLWEKPGILDNIMAEVVDLVVYMLTLKEQYEKLLTGEESKLWFTEGGFKPEVCPTCGSHLKWGEETSTTNTGGFDSVQYVSGETSPTIRLGDEPSRTTESLSKVGGLYVGQPTEHTH